MRVVVIGALLVALSAQCLDAQVRVRGYTRKDGTYVQPHYRSRPDTSVLNNWSTRGNINPYTGAAGGNPVWPGLLIPLYPLIAATPPLQLQREQSAQGDATSIEQTSAQATYSRIDALSSPGTDFSPQ